MRHPALLALLLALPTPALASGGGEGSLTHRMMELAFQIGVILFAARLGGWLMKKIDMPSVLGELMMGIVIGPYLLGGLHLPGFAGGLFPLPPSGFPVSPELYGIATLASIILLFHAGLETDLPLFLRFSAKGAVIGVGGVVASFAAGAWAGTLFTEQPLHAPVNLFLGVISTATSVGITARILSDQRRMDSPEGVTILAAAVIDDVLGIIVLAIVLGIVSVLSAGGGSVDWGAIGGIAFKAVGVWLGFTALGLIFARKIGKALRIFGSQTSIAVMSLGLALLLSGIFEMAGLAMIIGAYVMGLSLSRTDLSFVIQDKLHPLQEFFVPVFFCVMGMLVNVNDFLRPEVLLAGLLFSVVGIVSKLAGCGLPSLAMNFNLLGATRIGVGMVPRGEVALIMAGIGIAAGILDSTQFGVAVFMTLVSTLVPPPILTALLRSERRGTRTEMRGSSLVVNDFAFPSPEMKLLALSKVGAALRAEGFYIHNMELDHPVHQARKESVFFTFHEYEENFEVVCDPQDVHYLKTVVYEALLALNNTVEKLRTLARPETMKKELAEIDEGKVRGNFFKLIPEGCISLALKGETKQEIIEELIGMLAADGRVEDVEDCVGAVMEREASMSTGMQHGIAIPHGKSNGVKELMVAIGIKQEGVDFDSVDGEPSRVFFLTLSPRNATGAHIQFLSSLSVILSQPELVQTLLACEGANEIKDLLVRAARSNRQKQASTPPEA
ncbi:MAG: cation:proton antiporter [Deltaproteobacteria bacterium]|nr:cation:proton antiporter [Deltaproteobacteria bacterium]